VTLHLHPSTYAADDRRRFFYLVRSMEGARSTGLRPYERVGYRGYVRLLVFLNRNAGRVLP
jgi:hypothetical protein